MLPVPSSARTSSWCKISLALTIFSIASVFHATAQTPVSNTCKPLAGASSVQTLRVVDPAGVPVERAAIELRCGSVVYNGITGEDGTIDLSVRPGEYALSVRSPGFADVKQSVQVPGSVQTVTLPIAAASDVVNVTADTGFVPYESNAGSKTNSLLVEVPQSISIVNQREMESRQVITMNEALRYTPGIAADEYGVEPRFDWLKIRGFDAQTFGVFRDGMRFNSLAGKLDPFELESVEILHGPSSVLYGEVPPGGLINQVTKRPQSERHTEITGLFGSYARRQGAFDTTGPFNRNNIWRYRLLGLVRDSGTQTNYTPDNRRLIAPSLMWHPSDRTSLTLLTDWQHDGNRWSQFLPAQGTLLSNPNGIIPVSTFLGEPGLEYARRDQGSAAYTGDHLFADGWNVHSNYRFQYINFVGRTFYGAGFDTTIPNNDSLVSRYAYAYTNGDHLNTVDTRALRRFKTGSWEQTVLFGYDYQHIDIRETDGFALATDINVYHPVYGQTAFPTLSYYLNNDTLLQQHGLYAQDQIKYRDHLVFTLGGRQDFAHNDISNFLPGGANFAHNDDRFTGRVGVTYVNATGIAPYFAYSTSFLPNAGTFIYNSTTGQSTTPAKPSDSRQVEGGVKFQPRTWTSFFTASVFQINQTNVVVENSAFNNLQSGEVRSRGVELEGVAALARGLNLHSSYTLTATDTVSTTPGASASPGSPNYDASLGKWLPQTPRNQFSTLLDYTRTTGRFTGLGGNFGVRFVGTNAADTDNSFFVPNYTLLDAGMRFSYWHTLFSVNATNLTDRRYVATCSGLNYCYYGYARNMVGSAKYRF